MQAKKLLLSGTIIKKQGGSSYIDITLKNDEGEFIILSSKALFQQISQKPTFHLIKDSNNVTISNLNQDRNSNNKFWMNSNSEITNNNVMKNKRMLK